jgi:hypothetical protein
MLEKNNLSAEELQNIIENLPEDEKGNKIAPDSFFDEYFKVLPNGTKNASGTYRSYNGGRLLILGADPERDKAIHRAGANATNAMLSQRRTFKEEADILLGTIDKTTGKTCLENMTIAMYQRALEGDVKAYAALRDTAGEQPVSKSEITADIMTDADRQVIKNALERLKGQGQQEDQEEQ